jgi:hypothetical protein
VRVLSAVKQAEFYESYLGAKTVRFYYLYTATVDDLDYRKKLLESETLARMVMQLKAMNGHYPDGPQLEQIIQQKLLSDPFGVQPNEHLTIPAGVALEKQTTSRIGQAAPLEMKEGSQDS